MKKLIEIVKLNFNYKNNWQPKSNKFLRFGLMFIIFSVLALYISGPYLTNIQQRKQTTGFSFNMARQFLYFYYYKGLFPLATLDTIAADGYNKASATNLIEKRGQNLIMEYKHWSRMGENARIFSFLPDALINGPEKPSLKIFNSLMFLAGLLLLFYFFFRNGYGLLGFIICLIVLAIPFYQYAVFREKNIFALLASIFLMITGINARFIFNNPVRKMDFIIPLLSGVIISFFTEIRGEVIVLIFSLLFVYIFYGNARTFIRLLYILLLFSSFYMLRLAVRGYFDKKFDETFVLVTEKGGHPFTGSRAKAHSFWHPVFCGLGDFDKKYGYKWDDVVAYRYAIPILKDKYQVDLPYSGKYHFDAYYDKDSLYYIKFEEISAYESIVKEKVLHDIKNDPGWYISIILKRIERIFNNTLPFPLVGWLFLPLIAILILAKNYRLLVLLIVSFPLSFTPLLIYSGGNTTFNSFFPIIALAIIMVPIVTRLVKKNE